MQLAHQAANPEPLEHGRRLDVLKLPLLAPHPPREVEGIGLDWRERGELVEERNDEDRVDGDGKDLDNEHEDPDVVEEALSSLLNDG